MEIIPNTERSEKPLVGPDVLSHPDLLRANQWVLKEYEPPRRDLCVFVPCSKVKPYHQSPSHHNYDRVIFSLMRPDEVHIVVFGTCGVTPRELDDQYPYNAYDFVLGRCDVAKIKREFIRTEAKRLAAYLEKTSGHYKHRIAYCLGDFREAMIRAVGQTDVRVEIVPEDETLEKMKRPKRRFPYGSLSTPEYLQDLADIIAEKTGKKHIIVTEIRDCQGDEEWYRA